MMLGGLAMAVEPSPATADAPMSLGQSITTLGQFFAGGVGLVLIKVLMSLRGVFAGQIDERIRAAKASDAEKKDGAMPQPFVTTRDNPPVGSREFTQHRERNTAAHNEAFQAIRVAEEKLRGEIASGNATLLEKLETEIRELRVADQHNTEKLSAEITKLLLLVGELRGSVEALARNA